MFHPYQLNEKEKKKKKILDSLASKTDVISSG